MDFQSGISNGRIKFAKIDISATTDIVAAIAASGGTATPRSVRVLAYHIICDSAVTVKWQSNASTDLTGAMSFPANGGIATPFCPVGHFQSAPGEKLTIALGGSVGVRGALTYQEV